MSDESTTTTTTTTTTPWDGLSDVQKGFIDSKGFKDVGGLVDSYTNLEKLRGVPENQLLKLPAKAYSEDPKSWDGVFAKLGRPEKAEDYKFEVPENGAADEKMLGQVKTIFHSLGLTKAQGEGFVKQWNQFVAAQMKEVSDAQTFQASEEDKALRAKWGVGYDKAADQAIKEGIGLLGEEGYQKVEQALGKTATLEFFHKLKEQQGEQDRVDGNTADSESKTKEAAIYELERLNSDREFGRKILAGDAEAKAKLQRLQVQAFS